MQRAPTRELNHVLAGLPADEFGRLMPQGRIIPLVRGIVLHQANAPIEHVYFPRSGLVSLMVATKDGAAAEVGSAGFEGVIGAGAVLGGEIASTRAVVTLPGSSFCIPVPALRTFLTGSARLHALLMQHQQLMLQQAQQIAACSILHKVDMRLCRWLLQAFDRYSGTAIPMTQENLAQLLGVHRATLNEASAALRKDGIIDEGRRGWIQVKDRERLRARACECYSRMKSRDARDVPAAHTVTMPTEQQLAGI